MPIVTLAAAKAYCRADDFGDDDALIASLIPAAEAHIEQNLGYTFAGEFPDTDDADFPENVPEDLKNAVLQLVAHRYGNREASAVDAPTELPLGVWDVIRERRAYTF